MTVNSSALSGTGSPADTALLSNRVAAMFDTIARADRPEVWITLRPEAEVSAEIDGILVRAVSGEHLPLAGLLFAVKDNIDVAGLPTTAACPGFAHPADMDATAVARLRAAGAVVLGKTNLDQFATGLVGTRSPYGAVRSAEHPDRISGGSSSGSAVAVALSVVDFSLGTDTAGSGRVPAALQGIVGLKASVGLVPTTGVLPACRTLDCVTVFAREFGLASTVLQVIQGVDGVDSLAVDLPASAPLAAPENAVIAVPRPEDLTALAPLWRTAFDAHLDRLRAAGHTLVEIDITPFLTAAALLYNGAFVAERYAAVGEFIEGNPEGLDPIVAKIVRAAGTLPAHRYASDLVRLADLKAEAERAFAGADAMLLPTTTHHPSLAEVAAEPIAVNSRLGTFTNFANLFGYPAFAVPIDSGVEGENVGVQVLARPFADAIARDVALQVLAVEAASSTASSSPVPSAAAVNPVWADTEWSDTDTTPQWESTPDALAETRGFDLLVVGAHLSGLPLHGRLRRHGALFAGEVRTANGYTLVALGDPLNRPGMVRTSSDSTSSSDSARSTDAAHASDAAHSSDAASSVLGELWRVPETALSALLLEAAAPLGLGRVTLADGREVIGYLCEASAAEGKTVIADGDWRAHVSLSNNG